MALIEREAALNCAEYDEHYRLVIPVGKVKELTTIDPIRAAGGCRCGECKHWDDDRRCEPPENGLIREYTKPTDFCSYGEPKEARP